MFVFKTSGQTFDSVIANQKHAFASQPKDWHPGELVLVSKNRSDCQHGERQIQYLMTLEDIRPLQPGESELYWPGTEGRWRHLVSCRETRRLRPFDLEQALGLAATRYARVQAFSRLTPEQERSVVAFMASRGLAVATTDAQTSTFRTPSAPTGAGVGITIHTDARRP